MKKIVAIISVIFCIITLSSCEFYSHNLYFGFSKQDFIVLEEQDSHGGFLGDGAYYLILDCTNNVDAALKNVEGWKQLPLSKNLDLIMYGGEKDDVGYEYYLHEHAHMPVIKNGFYCFKDRHDESKDPYNDSELLSRVSYNFSLAVYDSDTNRFYFFAYDT